MEKQRRGAVQVLPPPESKGRQASALTARQEAFAHYYVALGSAIDAYKAAYDTSPNASRNGLYVAASRLLHHPKTRLRIRELQQEAGAAAQLSSEYVIRRLMAEAEAGDDVRGKMGRIRALELLGRIQGMFVERHNIQNEGPVTFMLTLGEGPLLPRGDVVEAAYRELEGS